uniref:2-arachidonoylglycerol hydrolase ABHD12 n=1 Tax=Caenorhabditis japonica TaxID=281687 RepID=A0A8R1HZ98_CAEJA
MLGYFITLIHAVLLCITILVLAIVVFLPILVFFLPQYTQFIFFLNFRRLPNTDYNDLASNDVKGIGRSLHLRGGGGKIGVWHVLPHKLNLEWRAEGRHPTDADFDRMMNDSDYKIILYAHGNSFDRTFYHRVEMYNLLSERNFHVICFDYRGYGDSEGTPTEKGIVADARTVYDWVREKCGKTQVIVWGHSMGTGVSCKLVQDLSIEHKAPCGLVLESPFNNLKDAVTNHPIFTVFCWMNDFMVDTIIIRPLNSVGLSMQSDKRIAKISCPIIILHAEDDKILPLKLGRALFEAARRADRDIKMREFSTDLGFGHKFICRSPELPEIIDEFVRYVSPSSSSSS